jgi:hypothetical protein
MGEVKKWRVVSYDIGAKVLTTTRDNGRYEDFFYSDDKGNVEAYKHFGDHDYDSGTTVSDVPGIGLAQLINAAIMFHHGMGYTPGPARIRL